MKIAYLSVLIFILIYLIYENNNLQTTVYRINNKESVQFAGGNTIRLVHISDLHNKKYGRDQHIIISRLIKLNPDIICITGDLVHNSKKDNAINLVEGIKKIAPIIYCTGNHEYMAGNYQQIRDELKRRNVLILENTSIKINIKKISFDFFGLDDPMSVGLNDNYTEYLKKILDGFTVYKDDYNILLTHRPEEYDIYNKYGFDLILSGHAHGGQIRLPVLGGLIAPNQGLFPKYYESKHSNGACIEIISRGLGNSVFPFRVNNRPEIVVCDIVL